MPAISDEVEEALKEGIKIEFLTIPIEAYADNGRLSRLKCRRMALGPFDESGRRSPVPVEGAEFELEVDTLIPAIGQQPDLSFLNGNSKLRLSKWKTLKVDSETMATNVAGIFAGGDVVSGPATVLEAMKAGQTAAQSIHRYLRGEPLAKEYKPSTIRLEVPPVEISPEEASELLKPEMPKIPLIERRGSFKEVEIGLNEQAAVNEAKRCFRCDLESLRIRGG